MGKARAVDRPGCCTITYKEDSMIQLITRTHALGVLAAGVVACCAVLAQS